MCSYVQLVARSCTLSGLSIWCGCTHDCTLGVLRDILVANLYSDVLIAVYVS